MAKIKMRYKEIAKRVTRVIFRDYSKLEAEERKDAQAFQKFVEYLIVPAGEDKYSEEILEIHVLESLIRADLQKQKNEKQLNKLDTKVQKATKKFVAQKQREKFWNKVMNFFNPMVWGKQGKGEAKK